MSDFGLKAPYASRVFYINSGTGDAYTVDSGAIEWRFQIGSFDVLLNEDHTFTLANCVSKWEATDFMSGYGSAKNYWAPLKTPFRQSGGPFAPTFAFKNLERHPVFLRFLTQN